MFAVWTSSSLKRCWDHRAAISAAPDYRRGGWGCRYQNPCCIPVVGSAQGQWKTNCRSVTLALRWEVMMS